MPKRTTPLIDEQIYHVFNRGIDHRPIFQKHYDFRRALETIDYYRNINPPIKFSRFLILSNEKRTTSTPVLKMAKNIPKFSRIAL